MRPLADLDAACRQALAEPVIFAQSMNGVKLRRYQVEVLETILNSIKKKQGLTFVVIFPRQSGKNELQAQLESYLITALSGHLSEIVKVSPTWKPQSLNAMRRLERLLKRNCFTNALGWQKESGYIFRMGSARIYFLSGAPTANIVGATASTLLEIDEAQDVQITKYDKEINPMAASTNATRVFWGTAWTSQTLLAREMRSALEAERRDGIKRVFKMTADEVGAEVPAYRAFVDNEIHRMGRNHPFVRTQFYSEDIDAEGGMFSPGRIALMRGSHPQLETPPPAGEQILAFLIDVGGEDKDATPDIETMINASTHDSTVLTCVQIDLSTLDDPVIQGPTYHVIWRRVWVGAPQTTLYAQIKSLADAWQPRRIIIDATGIGAGLASNLERSFGSTSVVPFIFTGKSKSDLAWNFIALIETGRYKEYSPLDETLYHQLVNCQLEILPGPARLCRWGVPDGTRDPMSGDLIHDDLILSAALAAELDNFAWGSAKSDVVPAHNPLENLTF